MSGLFGQSFCHLFMLLVIISGKTLPMIFNACYSKGEGLANRVRSSNIADYRILAIHYQIKDFHLREYLTVDSPFSLKNRKKENFLMAPLGTGNSKHSINLIEYREYKRTVIRDIVV